MLAFYLEQLRDRYLLAVPEDDPFHCDEGAVRILEMTIAADLKTRAGDANQIQWWVASVFTAPERKTSWPVKDSERYQARLKWAQGVLKLYQRAMEALEEEASPETLTKIRLFVSHADRRLSLSAEEARA